MRWSLTGRQIVERGPAYAVLQRSLA